LHRRLSSFRIIFVSPYLHILLQAALLQLQHLFPHSASIEEAFISRVRRSYAFPLLFCDCDFTDTRDQDFHIIIVSDAIFEAVSIVDILLFEYADRLESKKRDYYEVLGVQKGASVGDIKKSYYQVQRHSLLAQ
jgi:hypothetical protein